VGAPGDERDELRLAFPLWGVGAVIVGVGIALRRPLLVLAGIGAIVYDRRAAPVDRTLRTLEALARRRHDETPD
jgi:hypothetical protein